MLRRRILPISLLVIGQLLAACAGSSSPQAVVEAFYQALNDGDSAAAMSYVADDIQCRGHCYINGKESFGAFIQENMTNRDHFELTGLEAEGDTVTFDYVILRNDLVLARGVDAVMRVEGGVIVYFEIR